MKLDRIKIESTFTHFVMRRSGYCGRGVSIKDAMANLRVKGGRIPKGEVVNAHWGTSDIEVRSDGSVHATEMVYLGEV